MPVQPTITGIAYKNDHKFIEEAQLHPPLGYRPANNDTFLTKSIHGENVWQSNLYQQPVIGFVSLGSSVSVSDGDRYIVLGSTVDGSFGNATPNSIVGYLTIDGEGNDYNEWDYRNAETGMLTYVSGEDKFYYFDGSIWKELSSGVAPTDKDNATATMNGGANNGADGDYVDLFTPAVGKIFEAVLTNATSLTPSDASISIVLHDGTPANDIVLVSAVSVPELNIGLSKFGCNGEVVTSGYELKLLVTGNDVSGTITIVANYLI